jgi:hypothetical protein
VRLFVLEKILFVEETHDQKKEEFKPKHLARKMFQQKYLGFSGGLRYESTPFVLRQYYQFFKVKIYSGTDNFQTTLRQFGRYIYVYISKLRSFLWLR